jgi:hypothetical protein
MNVCREFAMRVQIFVMFQSAILDLGSIAHKYDCDTHLQLPPDNYGRKDDASEARVKALFVIS